MVARLKRTDDAAMASRWRRRALCLLLGAGDAPGALRRIDATGAFVETNLRPALGEMLELKHPDAGRIPATVAGVAPDGIALRFDYGARSVAFALSAIAADMSRPAR